LGNTPNLSAALFHFGTLFQFSISTARNVAAAAAAPLPVVASFLIVAMATS